MKFALKLMTLIALIPFSAGATATIGTVFSNYEEVVILDDDLPEQSAGALGTLILGHAVDALALHLGKFEKVPRYRVTRLLKAILVNNSETKNENADVVIQRIVTKLKSQCVEGKACTFKLIMKSSDWLKPVPNLSAPASERDIQFYSDDFFRSYYQTNIQDQLNSLKRLGKVSIFGQAFERPAKATPMTREEEADFKKLLVSLYKANYMANHFVKTNFGTFWADPINAEFRSFPWGDVVIRSKTFPANYQELVKIVEHGLNKYYLSQKREEVFNHVVAFKDGNLIQATQYLLNQVQFFPIRSASGPQISGIENAKAAVLENIQKIIKEKSEMAAVYIVRQSILTMMDRKEKL